MIMCGTGWRPSLISSPINLDLPRIVILGRPNVGKSTLFNRLLGARRAITHSMPGVTRDAVEKECTLEDVKVLLTDTGGFTLQKDELNQKIIEKSLQLIKSAEVALLLSDAHLTTGEDQAFVEMLRPYSDKIILVVNKIDDPVHEAEMYDKYQWGFSHVIGISAEHGRNIDLLKKQIVRMVSGKKSAADGAKPAEARESEIKLAVLGKPNTGKSTLVNHLLGEERSIVSAVPGTTRDIIEGVFTFKQRRIRVLDTAGIRRKKKISEAVEYYSVNRAIKSIDECDVVALLIDALEGLSEQDKKICMLVVKRAKGLILVLNKWDLLPEMPNRLQAFKDRIRFLFPVMDFVPIIPLSAKQGMGTDKLIKTVVEVWHLLHKRVDTSRLNKKLAEWTKAYVIPGNKRRLKIRYATQVSVNPIKFIFFLNILRGYPQSYTQYLKNKIRRELGFSLVPFDIELRKAVHDKK